MDRLHKIYNHYIHFLYVYIEFIQDIFMLQHKLGIFWIL